VGPNNHSSNIEECEPDQDSTFDITPPSESDPGNVDSQIQSVNAAISALPSPPSPPLSQASALPQPTPLSQQQQQQQQQQQHVHAPSTSKRTPKCKQCGHPRKGHTHPKNGPVKCPKCRGGLCTSHNPSQPSLMQQQLTLQSNVHYGHVTEWILPHHLSQSMIFGIPIGSNACTIIAAIGAMKFLSGSLPIPSSQRILRSVATFANSMREGNIHYNTLNLPTNQPNLDAHETLQTRTDNFGLRIVEDTGVMLTVVSGRWT